MSDLPTTLLVITGMGVPPYSARGLTQTFQPIENSGHLERSVNGPFIDFSNPAFKKYASKITCTDQDAPALSGIWIGALVTVQCVFEFSFLTANPSAQERPAVPGSTRTEGDFTFYRPQLEMVVMNFNASGEEYEALIRWELDLEEQ